MDSDSLIGLSDIFACSTDRDAVGLQAEYSIQFLFRDLFSSMDTIGPCFMMNRSMSATTIDCVVRETIAAFYRQDFRILALIFDGASSNMSYVKNMFEERIYGSFGKSCQVDFIGKTLPSHIERFRVPSSVPHPFEPDGRLFVIVCPSHVLKCMVNALHSSKSDGTRTFWNQTSFGWCEVAAVYDREVERRKDPTKITMVPGLLKSHVIRDSWTKLSVAPALILVRENFISEMKACGLSTGSTTACVGYLEALNRLFVNEILSHEKIWAWDSVPIESMILGFEYFCRWHESLESRESFQHDKKQKEFISWQTFDILRVMFFGFVDLCNAVWNLKPGSYLVGLKVNGSAVETLFSQIKARSGQELTSTNYLGARRSLLVSRDVEFDNRKRASDYSAGGYRNADLNFCDAKKRKSSVRMPLNF